jgi:hypothetical protein
LGAMFSLNSMEEAKDTAVWTYLVVATWLILNKRKMKG